MNTNTYHYHINSSFIYCRHLIVEITSKILGNKKRYIHTYIYHILLICKCSHSCFAVYVFKVLCYMDRIYTVYIMVPHVGPPFVLIREMFMSQRLKDSLIDDKVNPDINKIYTPLYTT